MDEKFDLNFKGFSKENLIRIISLQKQQIIEDDALINKLQELLKLKPLFTFIKETQSLKNDLNCLRNNFTIGSNEISKCLEQYGNLLYYHITQILSKNKNLLVDRQILSNELQLLKGNIRIYCRIKPDKNTTNSNIKYNDVNIVFNNTNSFNFDRIFPSTTTNTEIFHSLTDLVYSVLEGYNVSVFAYGPSATGKSYTMIGNNDINLGINYLAIKLLLENAQSNSKENYNPNINNDTNFTFTISIFEIYNNIITDLLTDFNNTKLKLHYNINKIDNLTCVQLINLSDLSKLINKANNKRKNCSTNINDHSSRSHYIIIVQAIFNNKVKGTLNLIDLAGSERLKKSLSQGQTLKEAKNINKSLSSLTDVIIAKGTNSNHVPFRNSILTSVLYPSLSSSSKTLIILHISSDNSCSNETLNTLRFGSKLKNVHLGHRINIFD